MTHIDLLKLIIPRPKSALKLPYITLDQTIKLIMTMKTSNSLGHDIASIKIYKMLAYRLGQHIQHLINTIIKTGTYPDILKLSKITLQKKNLTNQLTKLTVTDQLTIFVHLTR